jgi:hypothetical protein
VFIYKAVPPHHVHVKAEEKRGKNRMTCWGKQGTAIFLQFILQYFANIMQEISYFFHEKPGGTGSY